MAWFGQKIHTTHYPLTIGAFTTDVVLEFPSVKSSQSENGYRDRILLVIVGDYDRHMYVYVL